MLIEFNPIIMDVVICVLLISIIAIGALKGIVHTSINFVLLLASVALSFAPFMSGVKEPLIKLLADKISLGAGVTDEVKLALYLSYNLIISLALVLTVYLVLRLIKLFVLIMMKHRDKRNNKLIKRPNKVERITGGVFSLIFNGAVVVVLLSIFANPLIGGNKTLEKTYVSRYIEVADDELVKVFADDEEVFGNKMLVQLIKGDIYSEVSDESAKNIKVISQLTNGVKFAPESLEDINVALINLKSALSLLDELGLDENGEPTQFKDAIELAKNMATKSVNGMKAIKGDSSEKIDAKNTLAIYNLLNKFGLESVADTFEETFILQ